MVDILIIRNRFMVNHIHFSSESFTSRSLLFLQRLGDDQSTFIKILPWENVAGDYF